MNKAELRDRIIRRLRKMRDEIQQTIIDKEYWNDNRDDAPPFDLGWDRVMLQCVNGQLEAWERDDIDTVNKWNRRMQELTDRHESEESMPENKIDMMPYCNPDSFHLMCSKPWRHGDYIYATDGCILVRVPYSEDYNDVQTTYPETPNATRFFEKMPSEWQPLPKIVDPTTQGLDEDFCITVECPECCEFHEVRVDGMFNELVRLGEGLEFARGYLWKLRHLNNVEYGITGEGRDRMMIFRFDGGVGALMPMGRACSR